MSGETWTEYGVRAPSGKVIIFPGAGRHYVEESAARWHEGGAEATVVGRTVTASPWLPVEDQP